MYNGGYKIIDFSKYGDIEITENAGSISNAPQWDTDAIHDPSRPILVQNLSLSNGGTITKHAGFADYVRTAGDDMWYLGSVSFKSDAAGQITFAVATA